MDANFLGNSCLSHPCFTQAGNLVPLFLSELLVVLVVIFHDRPWLSVGAETIPSTHSLFKLQSVALIVLLQHEYVYVAFVDSGPGIRSDHLPLVFDPYFTTADKGETKGKGLGLTIAYSIVKKHAGYILIDSEYGKGTKVRMLLPAIVDRRQGPDVDVPSAAAGGRVLLMDDERLLREMAQSMLSRMGYEVELASDGPSAIDMQQRALEAGKPFRVAILDLTIPGGIGGREVVKILRQQDPQIRAIVSSGYAEDPVLSDHRRHGFVDTLRKPYSMQALETVMGRVMGGEDDLG